MPHQSRIRPRPACGAALVALAMLAVSEFAGAQGAPAIPQTPATEYSISLLPPEQMTADDQAVAQRQQPAIAESAQFYGFTLDSSYTYRQMACPVAPNHLLLAYEATSPNGSISRFTAVVRRGSQSEVTGRQIPRSDHPHSPFRSSALHPRHRQPALDRGLQLERLPSAQRNRGLVGNPDGKPAASSARTLLSRHGRRRAGRAPFSIIGSGDHPRAHPNACLQKSREDTPAHLHPQRAGAYQVWALTFQAGGKLLTATRAEHPIDRTPLVLNAANSGSPSVSTGTTAVPSSAAPISSAPMTPKPSPHPPAAITAVVAPTAPAEPIAPGVEPSAAPTLATAAAAATPTPPAPAANPPAEVPTPAAPTATAAKVEVSPLAAPPPPAEVTAPVTHPATTPVSAPAAASTVEPVAPATPAAASVSSPQPLSVPTTVKPEPAAAATLTPQPPSPPSAPAATAAASAAIAPPPPPAVVSVATPLVVKPSPPLPLGRFIPNPPQPPSRFIPDSALKTRRIFPSSFNDSARL